MDNRNQMVKKVLATSLAANMFLGGTNALKTENVASAWWWSQNHSQEEIDSIYGDVERDLQACLESSKKLDNAEKAQSFIQAILDLTCDYSGEERTYDNALKFQKEIKGLQNEVDVELNLQEVARRKKAEEAEQEAIRIENEHRRKLEEAEQEAIRAENEHRRKLEEAEQEAIRIENEHRRKLEEQKLQMEKEERERLEQVNNAKASLSEKVSSIMRNAHKEIELPENIEHIHSIANEIEGKIQSVDNLNRVEGVETLIAELQTEIEKVLSTEAELRKEAFEKSLKEAKVSLSNKVAELQDLLSNLNSDNENFESINNAINTFEEAVNSLENLDEVNALQETFEEFQAQINSLLELQAQKEAERKALEELERTIENMRDPQMQLEMLSEGKITLDDVIGGNQKAKAKALALVKAFERYNKGGKFAPSKGLLLYGPPGTGKTSFVTAFAAEQGLELFFVNPSLVMGDNGERKVLETIEQAKKAAQISGKLVIFLIDEIDAIAQKRSSSSSDKVLVMLMNEVDKLKPSDNVIVFATTNRREALDQAIIRSGRLDQSVEVGLPNAEAKEKIMNIYLKNLKVAEGLNAKAFTDKMRGFCGADIKRAIDVAINAAMERQGVENLCDVVITNADIQEGIATIMDEKTTVY